MPEEQTCANEARREGGTERRQRKQQTEGLKEFDDDDSTGRAQTRVIEKPSFLFSRTES